MYNSRPGLYLIDIWSYARVNDPQHTQKEQRTGIGSNESLFFFFFILYTPYVVLSLLFDRTIIVTASLFDIIYVEREGRKKAYFETDIIDEVKKEKITLQSTHETKSKTQ
jgi:hypothetical protein